jgi:transcriptional regulator of nitric oxide reductase
MPKLTEAQLAKATQIFLAENVQVAIALLTVTQTEADILGSSVEEIRNSRVFAAMDRYARERGEDPMKLLYTLAAESSEEFNRMWDEHEAEIQKAIGL